MALIELLLVPDINDDSAFAVDHHDRPLRPDRAGRGAGMINDYGNQGNHPHPRKDQMIPYEFNKLRHAG